MIRDKRKKIAFIYEGVKSEDELFESIEQNFFSDNAEVSILSFPADGNLYMIWSKLKEDEFETDVIDVLKEMSVEAREKLEGLSSDDFAEVYMFFDYDGHNNNIPKKYYGTDVLQEMLNDFDNETELGKLYISYPMVEALKEISLKKQEYETLYLPLEESGNYKEIVCRKKDFQNFRKITRDMWYATCNASRKQAYLIVDYKAECTYTKFLQTVTQKTIYHAQKEKFIKENRVIAILNSIPLFLIEYFKEDFWNIVVK